MPANGILVTDVDTQGRTLFDDYTVVSEDSSPGFPFSNVSKVNGGEIWQDSGGRNDLGGFRIVRVSFPEAHTSDAMVIGPFKNLGAPFAIRLFQDTALTNIIHDGYIDPRPTPGRVLFHQLPTMPFQGYAIEFAISDHEGPVDDTVDFFSQIFRMRCAWVFMGRSIRPTFNFEYGTGFRYVNDSVIELAEDGTRFVEPGFIRKTWRGTWNDLTADDAEALAFVQEKSSTERMVYWNPYPDSTHPFDLRQAGVYHIEDFGEIKHSSEGTYSTDVFLVEAPTVVNTQD